MSALGVLHRFRRLARSLPRQLAGFGECHQKVRWSWHQLLFSHGHQERQRIMLRLRHRRLHGRLLQEAQSFSGTSRQRTGRKHIVG